MNKDEKAALVEDIAERLGDASAIFAVDYRGISVPQAAELRGRLAEADATFRVVKNRLAKRAAEKAGTTGLEELFEGPTALTFVKGDAVTAAKAISTFGRQHEILEYKGGLMDGAPLDPDQFTAIARLPGLDVLHGQLVGVAASPLTGLVHGLAGLISGLAVALGEIQERGLVAGETEAEAQAPAEAGVPAEERAGEQEAPVEAPAGEQAEDEEEAPAEAPAGEQAGEQEAPAEAPADEQAGEQEAPPEAEGNE